MTGSYLDFNKTIVREKYDPSNASHRLVLEHFLETGKWLRHFSMDSPGSNLPYHLMAKTLEYYFKKELKP